MKRKEKDGSSEEDSDDQDEYDEDGIKMNAQDKAIQFINSFDKEAERKTQPETQFNNILKPQQESLQENVLDMVSFHSKLSKSPMDVASLHKSIRSSKMSMKDKQQIQKVLKKVNFFCLRPENVVEKEDIDSQGMEEDMDYDLDDMNRSIQKSVGGLKRNPKSFNYN